MSEPVDAATTPPAVDATLDGIEADLDTVEEALAALDADDLDGAEALTAALSPDRPTADDGGGGEPTPSGTSDPTN